MISKNLDRFIMILSFLSFKIKKLWENQMTFKVGYGIIFNRFKEY